MLYQPAEKFPNINSWTVNYLAINYTCYFVPLMPNERVCNQFQVSVLFTLLLHLPPRSWRIGDLLLVSCKWQYVPQFILGQTGCYFGTLPIFWMISTMILSCSFSLVTWFTVDLIFFSHCSLYVCQIFCNFICLLSELCQTWHEDDLKIAENNLQDSEYDLILLFCWSIWNKGINILQQPWSRSDCKTYQAFPFLVHWLSCTTPLASFDEFLCWDFMTLVTKASPPPPSFFCSFFSFSFFLYLFHALSGTCLLL